MLESCDNPKPVANKTVLLTYKYAINSRFDELSVLTNNDGYFEFEYEKKNLMSDLTIRSNAGFGYRTLIFDLPKFKNVNIGNLYYENNFFGVVRLITDSISNINDTVFIDYEANKFKKIVTGPFVNEMVIDTIIDTYPVSFDELNNHKISMLYYWKSNKITTRQRININTNIVCKKYNFIDIILDNKLN